MTLTASEVHKMKHAQPSTDGVLPIILGRWSPRAFVDRDISPLDLRTIFEAARWAPSSFNEQPWRFIVGHRSSETYKKIAETLGSRQSSLGAQCSCIDPGRCQDPVQPQRLTEQLRNPRSRSGGWLYHAAGCFYGNCHPSDGGLRSSKSARKLCDSRGLRHRFCDGSGLSG